MTDYVYLSWGGSGRSACLRAALERAEADGTGLVYLAVLDDGSFADLDQKTLGLVEQELTWILDAQIEMAKRQVGAGDLPVRVVVRPGDLVSSTAAVVETLGPTRVLVGAPVSVAGHETVAGLLDAVAESTGRPVELIDPSVDLDVGGDGS